MIEIIMGVFMISLMLMAPVVYGLLVFKLVKSEFPEWFQKKP